MSSHFDGQATWYYRDGTIKQKAVYKSGKIDGVVVTFNQDGTVQKQVEYNNGALLESGKFPVSSDSPFIGVWKYIKYSPQYYSNVPPSIEQQLTATFFKNDILEIIVQPLFFGFTTNANEGDGENKLEVHSEDLYNWYFGTIPGRRIEIPGECSLVKWQPV
jgi:hypothetical protein